MKNHCRNLLGVSCFFITALTLSLHVHAEITNAVATASEQPVAVNQLPNQPDQNIASAQITSSPQNVVSPIKAAPIIASQKSSTSSQIASMLGGLCFILALIFGLSWFVKRFSQGGFTQSSAIKLISAMPLGSRERLMLVEVGGKQLLLGVTATQISNLHVFDEPVVKTDVKTDASDFSQKLMAILQQKNMTNPDSSASKGAGK